MTATLLPGHLLGEKYQVVRAIGRGGMGAVYEVRNHLGRRFAIKLLLDPGLTDDSEAATRLLVEAKAASAIQSSHVVEVFDSGVDPQMRVPFIVMELLEGRDLEQLLAKAGPIRPVAAARLVSQAASGLARAHEAGIVHRDIKPANVFLCQRDTEIVVKLLDFGIAKQLAPEVTQGALTASGAMLGTPRYMSPEQAKGLRTVDARSDLWSLGMCLYQALSGRLPFDASIDTPGQLILAICTEDPIRLDTVAPWVPPELAALVHRCLLREVDERMPSALALIEQLRPFCEGSLALDNSLLSGFAYPSPRLPSHTPPAQTPTPTASKPVVSDSPSKTSDWVPLTPTQPSGHPSPAPPPPAGNFGPILALQRHRSRHREADSSKVPQNVWPWAMLLGVAALGGAGGALASRALGPTSGEHRVEATRAFADHRVREIASTSLARRTGPGQSPRPRTPEAGDGGHRPDSSSSNDTSKDLANSAPPNNVHALRPAAPGTASTARPGNAPVIKGFHGQRPASSESSRAAESPINVSSTATSEGRQKTPIEVIFQ